MTDTTPGADDVRGLFDDFGAFRTPTADDFTDVLTGGLVAPDANVLLNLYRYTEQARTDLLASPVRSNASPAGSVGSARFPSRPSRF
ncbi:PIN-like domain-containing protein [Streptomyces sp. NPDC001381]|uniref:PIN-like domain-containing protein n=1 Tax=Streptomyces sp. NPDC001381 TaxID=3364567 RepID=UPI003695926B